MVARPLEPSQNIADRHPDAQLVRVNLAHPEGPAELDDRATPIAACALVFTVALAAAKAA